MRSAIVLLVCGGLGFVACGGVGTTPLSGSGGKPLGGAGTDGGSATGGSSGGASSSSGGASSGSSSGAGSGSSGGGSGSSGASSGGSSGGSGSGSGGGADAGGPTTDAATGGPCYSEPYDPNANVADLASAFDGQDWLTSAVTTMQRRYPTGYFVLNAEKNDPQLPQFVDASSWSALMSSLMTMLDVETGGWDFNNATASVHPFVILDTMQISVPIDTTWAQGEILQYITDSSTQTWDQTELEGQEGTYDGIFLFDDIDSAANGLAAATAVGDQITSPVWARDQVAAHLYYMELYLRDGRTNHATQYAAIKADPSWQKLVRYEWARGFFWDGQAASNPNLQEAAAPIWAHVNDPTNLSEIQQFTGEDPSQVACHP